MRIRDKFERTDILVNNIINDQGSTKLMERVIKIEEE